MRLDIGDGTRLFFDVIGPGLEPTGDRMHRRPTLLLLHGGPGMDHSNFRPTWDRLSDIAQVVLLDHRGQGRSDGWDDPEQWTLDVWADDVLRFCEALEIERPIVCGNSFGGMVAMHYAARHRGHPGAVILSSTATRLDIDLVAEWFDRLGGPEIAAAARAFWTAPEPAATAEYLTACGPFYTQQPGNLFDEARSIRNEAVTAHFVTAIQPTMDLSADPPRIDVPALVLAGALDPVCPIEIMTEVADAIDPALVRFEVFEQCGHGVFRDEPDAAFAVIREFVLAHTADGD